MFQPHSAGPKNAWNTGTLIIGPVGSERSHLDQKCMPGLETLETVDPYRETFYFGDETSLQLVFIGRYGDMLYHDEAPWVA